MADYGDMSGDQHNQTREQHNQRFDQGTDGRLKSHITTQQRTHGHTSNGPTPNSRQSQSHMLLL